MRYVVGPLTAFPPDSRRVLRLGGREIGVFRVGDAFYAVRNRCPHQGGPLCLGRVLRRATADGAEIRYRDGAPLLACPWHGWQYDLATGEAHAPGDPGARVYAVEVVPHAETFPVAVEGAHVVVEA